jgi:hypothetical protein
MTIQRVLLVLAAACAATSVHAQLIGPIPPKPDSPEPGASGPLGPAPEVRPPDGEPRAPSIVERGADGRLKSLSTSPVEAALARYPFDADHRSRIEASRAARRRDVDHLVVEKLDSVLEVQRLAPQVEAASDFQTLFKARDAVAALRMEQPLDRLLRDGAITLEQKVRIEEALREYDVARKRQIEADAKGDPTRAAVLNLRQTFDDVAREPLASLDRQLATLSDHIESVLDKLALRDDQRKATDALRFALRSGVSTSIHAKEMRRELVKHYWLDVLDMEQKRRALLAAGPDEPLKAP